MAVRMELSRILIRELNDYQIIELREVAPISGDVDADGGDKSDGEPGKPGGNGVKQEFSQVEGGRAFPIVIGLPEAQAIERRLKGAPIKRPQTHDLLMNIIESLGAKLESIAINDLSDQTFYAVLNLRDKSGKLLEIDSRPSDAIALGIASNVPIYVAEHVLDAVQKDEE
ncbi:MAG: bifunctional nuclease family protein [Phycisphaerales bacterium]